MKMCILKNKTEVRAETVISIFLSLLTLDTMVLTDLVQFAQNTNYEQDSKNLELFKSLHFISSRELHDDFKNIVLSAVIYDENGMPLIGDPVDTYYEN